MALPLSLRSLNRAQALFWASGLGCLAAAGLAPGMARAIDAPSADLGCGPLPQRCDPPIPPTPGLRRPLVAPLAQQLDRADRSAPPLPKSVAVHQADGCAGSALPCGPDPLGTGQKAVQLAQSFGSQPYGGPYPRPNRPYPGAQGPGPFPGPMPGAGVSPPLTPPANISFPAPGVICDQIYKLCYNNQGISQALSAGTFGQAGFASAMLAIQRGLQKQFLLSNGTFCDVSVPACWSDGMGRRIPSPMMSSQLFYSVNPGPGIYPGGSGGVMSGYATCRLQQGFQVLYSGQCQLTRQQDGNRYRFNAQMGNGMVYSFVDRNGSYRIRDNNGTIWPVNYVDQGGTGVFNWANYSLTLTQPGYSGGSNLGRPLGNLLESLFR